MNIKTWGLLIINSLVLFAVLFLSFTFYRELSEVLDDRVINHLNSIKTLKKVQLNTLIQEEWDSFIRNEAQKDSTIMLPVDQYTTPGIYDVTHLHPQRETTVAFLKNIEGERSVKFLTQSRINDVLLERAGMGFSGESYLVGDDYRLRSQSRFLPDYIPYHIESRTKGVLDGILGKSGTGIFTDYRGVLVYSAYEPLQIGDLDWVLLSEMDVEEISIPLREMQRKLLILSIFITILAVLLSLFLTRIITIPVIKMKKRLAIMAKGDYRGELLQEKRRLFPIRPTEINEMFEALNSLKTALSGAVDFSTDIGKMNLDSTYQPQSPNDLLGHSLVKMQENLIAFRNQEQQINLTNKRVLVERLEEERKRLARELHDGIGPLLTSMKFYVQNHIEVPVHQAEMKNIIDSTITEIRAMTNALMPSTLEDFGVGPALKSYVNTIQHSTTVQINFEDATMAEKSKITKQQAFNLFRIVQELINNTIKYASASQIHLTLSEFDGFISLYYHDNGSGFDMCKVTIGSGITNIRERVEIFHGTLHIESGKGATVFEIELPIENNSYDTTGNSR